MEFVSPTFFTYLQCPPMLSQMARFQKMCVFSILVNIYMLFSRYVVFDALQLHGLQHTRLSFTISWSLLKLTSIESVMPSNHLILCHPLLLLPSVFPSIRFFAISQLFASDGQTIRASASILPIEYSVANSS